MSARPRHASVTGAFYVARRLRSCDSHPARTPLHIFTFSLAKTSTQGDTV
jgi:hypothetical protein